MYGKRFEAWGVTGDALQKWLKEERKNRYFRTFGNQYNVTFIKFSEKKTIGDGDEGETDGSDNEPEPLPVVPSVVKKTCKARGGVQK
jgi:hypothetical protein